LRLPAILLGRKKFPFRSDSLPGYSFLRSFPLDFFRHKCHYYGMKVVEKDEVISGMLQDELRRCRDTLGSLEEAISALPKGVLKERKRQYNNKIYVYFNLKYRDGKKTVNKHIPNKLVAETLTLLDRRKKIEAEIQGYRKKISYLTKILGDKRLHASADHKKDYR